MNGKAYLVGAGPGRADLITERGLAVLKQAEVVLYDRLIARALLDRAPVSAEMVFVGKRPGHHPKPQPEINQLLQKYVHAGKQVVRLKGGDPFVMGRGGEEALALAEMGLNVEFVPGVTSALAVPAYAGIPVTQKNMAESFAVVTGYEDPTKPYQTNDWRGLANVDTLVILMATRRAQSVCDKLINEGRDPRMAAAAISRGTTDEQRMVSATLSTLGEAIVQANLPTPAMLVVGNVASLAEKLGWFNPSQSGDHVAGTLRLDRIQNVEPRITARVAQSTGIANEATSVNGIGNDIANGSQSASGDSLAPFQPASAEAPPENGIVIDFQTELLPTGRVYLVGAGPGDAGLITIRGRKAIEQADIVLYDRLVSPALLNHAKPKATLINVGKAPTRKRFSQDEINKLLLEHGQQAVEDKTIVVRLKGGDPFVFGLGGDECLALHNGGIPYEVVPGVSSITSVSASAGIPITHRTLASGFTVLSAHSVNPLENEKIAGIRWADLPQTGTLVVLMGVKKLPQIVSGLLAAGRDPNLPIAIIESGTTKAESVIQSTLERLGPLLASGEVQVEPPALIVIGEVVGLREQLGRGDAIVAEPCTAIWGPARVAS